MNDDEVVLDKKLLALQGSRTRPKNGRTQIYPNTVIIGGMPILARKRLPSSIIFVKNLQNYVLVLDNRQERALQVERMFRPARRQPELHQEGTGRHDGISFHSGSFLR